MHEDRELGPDDDQRQGVANEHGDQELLGVADPVGHPERNRLALEVNFKLKSVCGQKGDFGP